MEFTLDHEETGKTYASLEVNANGSLCVVLDGWFVLEITSKGKLRRVKFSEVDGLKYNSQGVIKLSKK